MLKSYLIIFSQSIIFKKKGGEVLKSFIKKFPLILILCFSCSRVPNRSPELIIGKKFPVLKGKSLSEKKWTLPNDLKGQKTILLAGYVERSQFDIDRWLIGLSMAQVKTLAMASGIFIGCILGI